MVETIRRRGAERNTKTPRRRESKDAAQKGAVRAGARNASPRRLDNVWENGASSPHAKENLPTEAFCHHVGKSLLFVAVSGQPREVPKQPCAK